MVFECQDRSSGETFAIKQYAKNKLTDPQRRNQVLREIRILANLDHSGIVRLHEAIETPTSVCLVLEKVQGESLYSHLKSQQNRKLPEDYVKQIMRQLVSILAYLHAKQVTHRDVKLENIIVNQKGVLKLIDFGFCCAFKEDTLLSIYCGTPSYMAPEIVQKRPH